MIAAGSGLRMCLIVSGIVKVSDAGSVIDVRQAPRAGVGKPPREETAGDGIAAELKSSHPA